MPNAIGTSEPELKTGWWLLTWFQTKAYRIISPLKSHIANAVFLAIGPRLKCQNSFLLYMP